MGHQKTPVDLKKPVPFTTSISGGIFPGKMIFISGVPNPDAKRITINLRCAPKVESNIALTFDIRLQWYGESNVVVRNSMRNGWWMLEERHTPYFPFMPNANFDMIIMAEQHQFKIAVNNQYLLGFRHRVQPLNRINTLQITGDVGLTQVRFQ
ncbi:galectin-5-like [Crassostrea angulata]|uniref:galectin-5-like n=1 Tax=Magallana angulata TaxID=2784310 RepID=UPI0022B14106|nr:galectin-5-like [Crassostrea angulata]